MSVALVDAGGGAVPLLDGRFEVEEAQRYALYVPQRCAAWLDERPLPYKPEVGGFSFSLPQAVGAYRLELAAPSGRATYRIVVRPAASKLSDTHWEALLADLDRWLPGLIAGAEGATTGHVGTHGVSAPLAAAALIPLAPALQRALAAVIERPRTLDVDRLEDVGLHRTRRPTGEAMVWLARHPDAARWLDVDREEELTGAPPLIPQRVLDETRDHPANRHLRWLVDEVCRALRAVAAELDAVTGHDLTETTAWTRPRAVALRDAADRLDAQVRRSFLAQVAPRPATEAALLVVADHPRYARVHRLARRFLSPRFARTGAGPSAATRPSFELYELWCFLAVWRALRAEIGDGVPWKAYAMSKLLDADLRSASVRVEAPWRGGTLAVHFNPTFGSVLGGVPSHGRWSLSTQRRPDITVSWDHPDHPAWVCLDAKYRAGARNLGDGLTSLHIYRDSLRWDGRGGGCRVAALLAPAASPDCALWFSPAFREEHGVGIWQLCPGVALPDDFGAWICAALLPAEDAP